MPTYSQLNPEEQYLVNFKTQYNNFHTRHKIWKCHQQNGVHFVQATLYLIDGLVQERRNSSANTLELRDVFLALTHRYPRHQFRLTGKHPWVGLSYINETDQYETDCDECVRPLDTEHDEKTG